MDFQRDEHEEELIRAEEHRGNMAWASMVEVPALKKRIADLETQLEGERKARELLLAGMESVCEGRDQLKHKVRELEGRLGIVRKWAGPIMAIYPHFASEAVVRALADSP